MKNYSLIFLHGFSMEPEDMIYYTKKINKILPNDIKFNYIYPKAYKKRMTFNNKIDRAWYNYYTSYITKEEEINYNDLIKTRKRIHKLIDKESLKYNNDTTKIFIAGYSQGCCSALDIGLSYSKKLGGIIGFKGHIINYTFKDIKTYQNIWVTHGKKDDTIAYKVAKESYDKIPKKYITFLSQNTDHEMNTGIYNQINSLKHWLLNIL